MNSENSQTSEPHISILKPSDKLDLRRGEKSIALSNRIKSYNNNKFKISSPIWNDEFELSDDSYSISDIQNYLSIF